VSIISVDLRLIMGNDQRAQRLSADVGDMMRAGLAVALNQRMDNLLAHAADLLGIALVKVLVGFLAADIGRIGFHDLAVTAERASLRGCGAP
jgi:hypothetical protein